ncbi:hypothetical protein OSB04_025032 [Centaurea solstitialis]|uniref:Protein kinase domain-containing protein n=1 Tax=Centaurea solstitialis TaxID=347529 RepID=A0AA38SMA4_9ASTR|nr:hypothetical protein OSB04_025032 [Centaurea solstitialis]
MKTLALILLQMLLLTASGTNTISETFALVNATNLAKPGCPDRCGDLIVPYPFGIGINSNCSISFQFDIHCDTSLDPPKASLAEEVDYSTIKQISDSRVRISNMVSTRCYSPDGEPGNEDIYYPNFVNFQYTVSEINKLTVIGCNDYAWVKYETKSAGCLATCYIGDLDNFVGDDCSGHGCCQSSIPKDMNYYLTQFYTFQQTNITNNESLSTFNMSNQGSLSEVLGLSSRQSLNPCTYAFIGDMNAFKFNGSTDFNDTSLKQKIEDNVPIVLEWAIGYKLNCSAAKPTIDFACQSNSECVDSPRESGGYRCICKEGYAGNPYLSPGCIDINECAFREHYPCYGACVNVLGSYTCKCKQGYSGDATTKGGCRSKIPILQLALGAVSGIMVLIFSVWMVKVLQRRKVKKLKEKFFKRNGGLLLQQQMSSGEGMVDHQTRLFKATELEKATGQFNEDRIIGRGGQGTVYKGMLTDGRIIAVKKSTLVDENQVETFINEVFILSQIIHKNVVKLLGCCLETEVPMLVYEFVSNGTLFDFLHDEDYEFPTLWKLRVQIATEIAGALSYLHSATSNPIYHRDVKSSNILLDDKFRAKVSDFGISKSFSVDQTHLSTLVKGTMGYLDPEYFQSSHLTDKSDVYSFGVVLLELLIGKTPIFRTHYGERTSLVTFILSMEDEQIVENVDDRVSDAPKEQLIAVANLAKRCVNLNGMLRPNMKDVAAELEVIRTSC